MISDPLASYSGEAGHGEPVPGYTKNLHQCRVIRDTLGHLVYRLNSPRAPKGVLLTDRYSEMTKRFKSFVRGIGSAVDVHPATNYQRFVPRQTGEERMRARWERVGKSLSRAVGQVDHEQESSKS